MVNKLIIKHITAHGYEAVQCGGQVYITMFNHTQRVENLKHAYILMGI